jgi:hypothetical protein
MAQPQRQERQGQQGTAKLAEVAVEVGVRLSRPLRTVRQAEMVALTAAAVVAADAA